MRIAHTIKIWKAQKAVLSAVVLGLTLVGCAKEAPPPTIDLNSATTLPGGMGRGYASSAGISFDGTGIFRPTERYYETEPAGSGAVRLDSDKLRTQSPVMMRPPAIDEAGLTLNDISATRIVSLNFDNEPVVEIARGIAEQTNIDLDARQVPKDLRITFKKEKLQLRYILVEFANALIESGYSIQRTATKYEIYRYSTVASESAVPGRALFRPQGLKPETLQKILKQYYPDVAIDIIEEQHALSFSGAPERVADAISLAQSVNERVGSRHSLLMLPLNFARAADIARDGKALADSVRGQGAIDLLPMEHANAVIVIGRSAADTSWMERWINRMDVGSTASRSLRVVPVINRSAQDIAQILMEMEGQVSSGKSATKDSSTQSQNPSQNASQSGKSGLTSSTSTPSTAKQPKDTVYDAGATQSSFQQGDVDIAGDGSKLRIAVDTEKNAILLSGSPRAVSAAQATIRSLDTPRREIVLQAAIVEVTLNKSSSLGVDALGGNSTVNALFSGGANGSAGAFNIASNLSSTPVARALPGGAGLLLNSSNLQAIVTAISQRSEARLLSAPRLLVAEGQDGEITVGDSVPTLTGQTTSVSTGVVGSSVAYVDTGVVLRVTPHIASANAISLSIDQEVVSPTTTTTSTIGSPTLSSRKISSVIAMRSGQTVALGGLIQNNINTSRTGVPFLMDLPYVGAAFSGKTKSQDRTELLVLMTVKLVDNPPGLDQMTDDFRKAMGSRLRETDESDGLAKTGY